MTTIGRFHQTANLDLNVFTVIVSSLYKLFEPSTTTFQLYCSQIRMSAANLQSLKYTNEGGSSPQLKVLDQLLVPHEKVYIDVPDAEMAYTVIKTMQIRGRLNFTKTTKSFRCDLS